MKRPQQFISAVVLGWVLIAGCGDNTQSSSGQVAVPESSSTSRIVIPESSTTTVSETVRQWAIRTESGYALTVSALRTLLDMATRGGESSMGCADALDEINRASADMLPAPLEISSSAATVLNGMHDIARTCYDGGYSLLPTTEAFALSELVLSGPDGLALKKAFITDKMDLH
jgi:hypothetical protein